MKKIFLILFVLFCSIINVYAEWPNKIVSITIPVAVGNGTDTAGRFLAEKLSEKYREKFIVINRVGGSGIIGTKYVIDSNSRGYDFLYTSELVITNSFTLKNVPYDIKKDLKPIVAFTDSPFVLVSTKKTYKELIDHIKNSDYPKFAIVGYGGPAHFAALEFADKNNIKAQAIPYPSSNAALIDLSNGLVDYAFLPVQTIIPFIENKTLNGLMILSDKRTIPLPNIPTSKQLGYETEINFWNILFAPSNVPDEIIMKLKETIEEIKQEKEFKEKLQKLGIELLPSLPTYELIKLVDKKINFYQKTTKKYNVEIR